VQQKSSEQLATGLKSVESEHVHKICRNSGEKFSIYWANGGSLYYSSV